MNRNILTIGFLVVAFFFALVLGSNVAAADYETLSTYAIIAIVVYFIANGWKNVWWFTALLVFSGVVFSHGFIFDANHLFAAMLMISFIVSAINSSFVRPSHFMKAAGGGKTQFFLVLLTIYGFGTFLLNFAIPYSPPDYALKTATKAYFEAYASMILSLWLLAGPFVFRVKPSWPRILIGLIIFAVVGNTIARGVLYSRGFQAADGLSDGSQDYFLYVPVINMQAGVYTLRDLTPLAVVILTMFATSAAWWREQSFFMKFTIISCICCALVGSAFSGGRASFPFCIGLIGMVCLVRRKIGLIMASGLFALFLIALVNIFSDKINRDAPFYVARSLQLVMIEKGDSYRTVTGSQQTREGAISQAFIEWKRDARSLIIGRSVFSITHEEALYLVQTLGDHGFIMNAMRGGRTHNLMTDLLLQYGLIGFILYMAAYIFLIIYMIRLARRIPANQPALQALVGAIAIYMPFICIYQLIGGQFMPTIVPLTIGITRAVMTNYENERNEGREELNSG